jgi:predicted ATPase
MPLSKEVRLLANKWKSGQGWPKRLEWIEVTGIRGWTGQRVELDFPIVALVGENGVGKSTVLQAIASIYRNETDTQQYASTFFPDTPWDHVTKALITGSVREGLTGTSFTTTVRKPTGRWRGNPERRVRTAEYIDLRRIQPISARVGYARIAKPQVKETGGTPLDVITIDRLSNIMGKKYLNARLSITDMDEVREVPVLQRDGSTFSGFHGGAGETSITELLRKKFLKQSIVLIDEVETSLHPRVQRRLIRDLAAICRETESQMVLTTHSPYVLSELPSEARIYIMDGSAGKQIIKGVSPEFAMSKMDEDQHPEADVYVEDGRAGDMLREIIISQDMDLISRVQFVPFGAASVGLALGQMISRFPRPSIVYLDGDQEGGAGCEILPGGDAPERIVFQALAEKNWLNLALRIGRPVSEVIDACNAAMTLEDHHEWLSAAGNKLVVGSSVLWQAMCAEWANNCLEPAKAKEITDTIKMRLKP